MRRGSRLAAVAAGGGVALVLVNVIADWLVIHLIPAELFGKSAAADLLADRTPKAMVLFMAVGFAPLFETGLAQWMPIELVRRLGAARRWHGVAISGLLFGLGHGLNGGLLHGLTALCAGAVLGALYTEVRADGWAASYGVTAAAHAINNTLVLLVGWIFPDLLP